MHTVRVSGPTKGLYQLIEHSKDMGVSYTLGMFMAPSVATCPAIEEASRRGLHVVRLSEYFKYDPLVILKAWQVVREKQVRILQSHGYKGAMVAWFLRNITGLPWIAFAHGYTSENRRVLLYNRLDRWLMKQADVVVAVSEATASLLREARVLPDRIRIIRNAVDTSDRRLDDAGETFRRECGFGTHDLVVGVIGRFSPEKGQQQFLQAFRRVLEVVPNAKAVLVGEGYEEDALRKSIHAHGLSPYVVMVSYRANLGPVYSGLDLVAIPSHSEGLPNVLLEAMSFGIPVIATKVGGIPEVMQERFSNCLVPPKDVSALANSIIGMLNNPSLRKEIGSAGSQYILENYSPTIRARRIVELYEKLVQ